MIELLNCDCMTYMASLKDKAFDLAIVDPPYGIGADVNQNNAGIEWGFKKYADTNWDENIPPKEYFNELERVSVNQIICGGNYFVQYLKPTMGWIVWDKIQRLSFSDGELIYTSFQKALRIFTDGRGANQGFNNVQRFHPTQKPIKLYKWILKNYAKETDKILDTHGGSMSIAIAAHQMNFNLTVCEIDKDYYDAAVKRFENAKLQQTLFNYND